MPRIALQRRSHSPLAFDGGKGSLRHRFFGLQGKLILSFSCLLVMALTASSTLFIKESREAISDILGEQARQIAQTLAMAAETPYQLNDVNELRRLGNDLLRSRNIVLVLFYDRAGQPLALTCRDPDFTILHWEAAPGSQSNVQHLMQVRKGYLPALGNFIQITAPVFEVFGRSGTGTAQPPAAGLAATAQPGAPLLGYITIGMSQNNEQALLQRISLLGVGFGSLIFLFCLPLASGLVYRIFLPIRQLVWATNRIAGGDYEARVATDRPDEIGMLARSFNDMALRIRQHQEALQIANANLAEANRSLEQKVHLRTRELENSNKRLSAEIAEKEDFLRAVSHDLNAPLRNIGGMATMLLMKHRGTLDEEIVHRLERIQKNVEMETDLIAELLELSRIKTRPQRREAVDLDALVHDLAGMFDNDLRQRQISLIFDNPLPTIPCERARMRQVFQNLIDNAIKYMGEGSLRQIHVGCREEDGGFQFYVRDTGLGIDAEDLPKVFYVFRRGRNSAGMKIAGKGVGLASVKSVIDTHHGRIWVESTVGQGSTFRFVLPRRAPDEGCDESRDELAPPAPLASPGGEPLVNAA